VTFQLTEQAERDVIQIYRYTAEAFGLAQADAYHQRLKLTFQIIGDQPHLARERREISPPVRVHPCGAHIILYTIAPNEAALIVRVRHGSEDWQSDPLGAED
jgi:toxin ParE1/3/4